MSASLDPVQTVIDILQASTAWQLDDPTIEAQWEQPQKTKENRPNPYIYVWSPLDTEIQQFGAEYDDQTLFEQVECRVWTMDESNTVAYKRDIVDILSDFATDNSVNTSYVYIRPQTTVDNRNEHISRMTDHYIASVTAELHRYQSAGT